MLNKTPGAIMQNIIYKIYKNYTLRILSEIQVRKNSFSTRPIGYYSATATKSARHKKGLIKIKPIDSSY